MAVSTDANAPKQDSGLGAEISRRFRSNIQTYTIILAMVAIWILFAILTNGAFFTAQNVSNLFRQMTVTSFLAIGMVFVIVTGNIDLSVGKLAGFVSVVAAYFQANVWYQMMPSIYMLWVPLIIFYTIFAALTIAFVGAAVNVYFRDVGTALPILLSLLMYGSPVIYPLQLVKDKLLTQQAAGEWSDALYILYTLNPLAGIIDAFQNVVLRGISPDLNAMTPGAVMIAILLPLSYLYFKRAERYFADVI